MFVDTSCSLSSFNLDLMVYADLVSAEAIDLEALREDVFRDARTKIFTTKRNLGLSDLVSANYAVKYENEISLAEDEELIEFGGTPFIESYELPDFSRWDIPDVNKLQLELEELERRNKELEDKFSGVKSNSESFVQSDSNAVTPEYPTYEDEEPQSEYLEDELFLSDMFENLEVLSEDMFDDSSDFTEVSEDASSSEIVSVADDSVSCDDDTYSEEPENILEDDYFNSSIFEDLEIKGVSDDEDSYDEDSFDAEDDEDDFGSFDDDDDEDSYDFSSEEDEDEDFSSEDDENSDFKTEDDSDSEDSDDELSNEDDFSSDEDDFSSDDEDDFSSDDGSEDDEDSEDDFSSEDDEDDFSSDDEDDEDDFSSEDEDDEGSFSSEDENNDFSSDDEDDEDDEDSYDWSSEDTEDSEDDWVSDEDDEDDFSSEDEDDFSSEDDSYDEDGFSSEDEDDFSSEDDSYDEDENVQSLNTSNIENEVDNHASNFGDEGIKSASSASSQYEDSSNLGEKTRGVSSENSPSFNFEDSLDDDLVFTSNSDKVVPTPPVPLKLERPVENKQVSEFGSREEEPKDLREFLRKHPHCELSVVYKYFSKKEVQNALMRCQIVKKGTKLHI